MPLFKEIETHLRPRERFIKIGKENLETEELIAILIQTGSYDASVLALARRIHLKFKSIRSIRQASIYDLMQIQGIGPVKAMQLLSALELGKRLNLEAFEDRPFLGSPEKVFAYLKDDLELLEQEHFIALYLDTKGHLIQKMQLFQGSLNASLIHQREIFKHAVRLSAATFIMVHNHPSGDPTPSIQDKRVTKVIEKAGELMDILLTDHIIIGQNKYYSFKAQGMMQ
jgi:DNA repair protein RadC